MISYQAKNSASAAKSSAKESHRRDAMRSIPLPNHHGNAAPRMCAAALIESRCLLGIMQAAPLVDGFGRVHDNLRIGVTDRCNIRCFYCMPETGVEFVERREILSFEEIERFARIAVGLGITKLRVTGGEPLVRRGLPVLIRRLAAIPGVRDLALTTNGVLLEALAGPLYEAGLRRLNVHLDTLDRGRFRQIAQIGRVIGR